MADYDSSRMTKELLDEFGRLTSQFKQVTPRSAEAEICAARMNHLIKQLQTKRSGLLMRGLLAIAHMVTRRAANA
jgi:hypothetical protein